MGKRELGQYFTSAALEVFSLKPFMDWATRHNIKQYKLLEPYAGGKDIVNALSELNLISEFVAYDIDKSLNDVIIQDNLNSFPEGFDLTITNPPYLAKNSARKRKITQYDSLFEEFEDLYEVALCNALDHCKLFGMIIPESFITSSTPFAKAVKNYCEEIISLTLPNIFAETQHPVCLALFNRDKQGSTKLWRNETYLGDLDTLSKAKDNLLAENPQSIITKIVFNDPNGELNVSCVDNSNNDGNMFFSTYTLIPSERIKHSSRAITRVSLYQGEKLIAGTQLENICLTANAKLTALRAETHDVFLTSFKGLRKDGKYRRRLDFGTIRAILKSI